MRPQLGYGPAAGGGGVDVQAARLGLKALTIQPECASTTLNFSSGTAVYNLVYLPAAATLTTCWVWVNTAGATSGGSNTMALYSEAGAKLAETGDMTAGFSSANAFVSGTLAAPVALPAGSRFYIAALTHFGSVPKVFGALTGSAAGIALPAAGINGKFLSVFHTGQTSFPASITPSSLSQNSGSYVMGVS